jgi:hypothetical protein
MSDHKKHFWEKKYDWDRPTLPGQRLVAWMFAVGERPRLPEEYARRRPHRGELPDVDFDRAAVDRSHRPLWLLIADLLFGSRHQPNLPADIEAELTAGLAVGERLATAYNEEDETGGAASRKDGGNIDPAHWSRAA